MRKTLIFATVITLALLGITHTSSAKDVSASHQVAVRVLPIITLTVRGKDGTEKKVISTYNVPQPTAQDLEKGYIEEKSAFSLMVISNVNWVVTVRALSENLGTSWDGKYLKPLSHFFLRSYQTKFMAIQKRSQKIAWGEKEEQVIDVDYRIEGYGDNYQLGSYKITLEYTITAQ